MIVSVRPTSEPGCSLDCRIANATLNATRSGPSSKTDIFGDGGLISARDRHAPEDSCHKGPTVRLTPRPLNVEVRLQIKQLA